MNPLTKDTIDRAIREFRFIGDVLDVSRMDKGHINDTYVLTTTEARYILQRVNTYVYKNPVEVMLNMSHITEHIASKRKGTVLSLVPALNGKNFYIDSDKNFWRAMPYLEGISYDGIPNERIIYQAGVAFGRFQADLSDFPVDSLYETIVDFHNTPKRYEAFEKAVHNDSFDRVKDAKELIELVRKYSYLKDLYNPYIQNGSLPLRATHNDTKLNNVLLDKKTNEPHCVLDLDTCMPGYSVNDFGDAIRSSCSTADKLEQDQSKIHMNLSLYKAYVEGFLKETKNSLSPTEISLLADSSIVMTYELGMRYLTDYLEGDVYFRGEGDISLRKARNQLYYMEDMLANIDEMKSIVLDTLSSEFISGYGSTLTLEQKATGSLEIAIKRGDSICHVIRVGIRDNIQESFFYVKKSILTLLWMVGGDKLVIANNKDMYELLLSSKDEELLSSYKGMEDIFGKPFKVSYSSAPLKELSISIPGSGDTKGSRIGLDLGGSDRKVSAVKDGIILYREEVLWSPKEQSDWRYHYLGIVDSLKRAASHLDRVDAIGVSTAGIVINDEYAQSNLFIKVPKNDFDNHVRTIFQDIAREHFHNVPIKVANDGDVAALGAMQICKSNRILGLALGTSIAAGYIENGSFNGWINELGKVPVNYNPYAKKHYATGIVGSGSEYLSQKGIIRLCSQKGLVFNGTLAEQLVSIQQLADAGNQDALDAYREFGKNLAESIAMYHHYLPFDCVYLLGRVMSGKGGETIVNEAGKRLLELGLGIKLATGDEKEKRLGQSVVAASLVALI